MSRNMKHLSALLIAVGVAWLPNASAAAPEASEETSKPKTGAPEAAEKAPARQAASAILSAKGGSSPSETGVAKVYTNEDLERLGTPTTDAAPPPAQREAGRGEAPRGSGKTDSTADPLAWLAQQRAASAERDRLVEEARQKVADLEERVRGIEKRILAIKNPYLARPTAPDPDVDPDWDQQTAPERVANSEGELEQAQQALEQARQVLAQLQAG